MALLAETDALRDTLSGPATKHLMQRALLVFVDTRYARLAFISVAHLYNLRAAAGYRARRQQWAKTRPTGIAIGERRAPGERVNDKPDGSPVAWWGSRTGSVPTTTTTAPSPCS